MFHVEHSALLASTCHPLAGSANLAAGFIDGAVNAGWFLVLVVACVGVGFIFVLAIALLLGVLDDDDIVASAIPCDKDEPASQFPSCKQCGYDLRATPHRCPECGTVPPPPKPRRRTRPMIYRGYFVPRR